MPYAIYQSGYCIIGVGQTPDEARAHAREWLADPDAVLAACLERDHTGARGDTTGVVYLRPCTERLCDEVEANGGELRYAVNEEGLLDLIDEDNEE